MPERKTPQISFQIKKKQSPHKIGIPQLAIQPMSKFYQVNESQESRRQNKKVNGFENEIIAKSIQSGEVILSNRRRHTSPKL